MKTLILLIYLTLSTSIFAAEIKLGMHFTIARKIILQNGWAPLNLHKNDNYEYMGVERKIIKRNYTELESCAIDRPACLFNYKKGNQCLHITTIGSSVGTMKIVALDYFCPSID